jgi:phytoene dehydrogenase-like protein
MEKSIIIIGGGLTGLSAGCYGRMNGYKTSIFEMHDKAGGVCTGWKRKGYIIDGAMNWLVGTKPGGYHKFWEELGAAKDWKIYNHDRYSIIENKEGTAFTVYCDADRLEQYLLELAPEDKDVIRELTGLLRSIDFNIPADKPAELYSLFDKIKMIKMLSFLRQMKKWGKVSAGNFTGRMKNPFLREMFPLVFGTDIPMIWSLMALSLQHRKMAGYPIGGALAFVNSIERRYLALGGEIHFNSRVDKILVEDNKALGVKLADGKEYRADWIISAGDGRTAIFDMLGGKYIDDTIKNMYDHPKLFSPLVYVGLGVNRSFDDIPPSLNGLSFPLDKPIVIAGKEHPVMRVLVYKFDPTLSPTGKNVVVVGYDTDYKYWQKLRQDPARYKAEKERICNDVIAGLEQRFPGITAQVEMRDVATPITWERYTGNWRGAYEGWQFSTSSFTSSMKKTLPGLDNFYMAGQWVNPGGGMPTAAMSGNHTIQFICKKDGKKFVTSKP